VADTAADSREHLAALLALAELPGIGAVRLASLVRAFGDAAAAVRASHGAIARLPGFTPAGASAVRGVSIARGTAILQHLERLGATVLTAEDQAFPALLKEIPDSPPLLFAWGDTTLLGRPAVAVVGSRNHSAYGAEAAGMLAADLARAGVTIVSGMARGIDALAHLAALDAGGTSVGVLGNGFGVIYPAANRALYERMVKSGCLLSEFPPGERPHAGAFPRRNRLISGLASATVVVEAALKSGAGLTADYALDQGRAVLAVPGPITSVTSAGCNRLIQQGAKPALSARDVLEEIGFPVPEPAAARNPLVPPDLTGVQRLLWDALRDAPRHVDALVAVAGGDAGRVLTALTELEMRGVVRQKPGMLFAIM
jgi:DNA processing protein